MKKIILLVSMVILLMLISRPANADFTIDSLGCSDSKTICVFEKSCDLAGQCAENIKGGCSSCPKTRVKCPEGSSQTFAECENTCQESGLSAGCTSCVPDCGAVDVTALVLQFDVIESFNVDMIIDPEKKAGRAGETLTYKAILINKNPAQVVLETSFIQVPDKWSAQISPAISVGASEIKQVEFQITSDENAAMNDYSMELGILGDKIRTYSGFTYRITDTYPPDVSISPVSNSGIPGATLDYDVTVKNNYPAEFGEKTFVLEADVPGDWDASFDEAALSVLAQNSATTKMHITSSETSTETTYIVKVKASEGNNEGQGSTLYLLDLNGDGICQPGEETLYPADCEYGKFVCDGRCETQTASGLSFDAQIVDFPEWTLFAVCSGSSSPSQCASIADKGSCGIGKACICKNSEDPSCSVTCGNINGVYYLYAEKSDDDIQSGKFSFQCPEPETDEISELLEEFRNAKEQYQIGKSAIDEETKRLGASSEAEKYKQCSQALAQVIGLVNNHITLLQDVADTPTASKISSAISQTDSVRQQMETLRKQCNGLDVPGTAEENKFRISSIDVTPLTEINNNVIATVKAGNSDSSNVYGYVECVYKSPGGVETPFRYVCGTFAPGSEQSLRPQKTVYESGTWTLTCKTYTGSDATCSGATESSSLTKTFDVYTKQINVQSVSGTCTASGVDCTVTLSQPNDCADCRLKSGAAVIDCTKTERQGNIMKFICPLENPSGSYDLEGFVFPTIQCIPIEPAVMPGSVSCSG